MATAEDLLRVASGELGKSGSAWWGSPTDSAYCRWYPMRGYWCAMFVSWAAAASGNAGVIPKHAYTPSGAQWFKDRGRWINGAAALKRGDIVYFKFSGNRIHHVGIVERVHSDGSITTIEGNTSGTTSGSQRAGGCVARKRRKTGIVGAGRPAYTNASTSPRSSGALTVDGLWGIDTTRALQAYCGLVVDGEVWDQYAGHRASNPGLGTGWRWTSHPTSGSPLIRQLQAWLRDLGHDPGAIDGIAGPRFFAAFQARYGLVADGKVWEPSPLVRAIQSSLTTGTL